MPIEAIATGWGPALVTTFALMAVSSVVAILVGVPAAATASLLDSLPIAHSIGDRFRRVFVSLWIAGMLFAIATPLILHAAAWESTAGKFGWLVKTVTGGNLIWVGWIHGIHGAAILAVLLFWATRNIPREVMQHASLDFTPWAGWWHVRWAIAKPWGVGGVIVVWLIAATEMSVADLHSVRTIADQFYLFYALDPTWTSVAMTTWIPLLLVIGPAIGWFLIRRQPLSFGTATSTSNRSLFKRKHFAATSTASTPTLIFAWLGTITGLVVCLGMMAVGLVLQTGHLVEIQDGQASARWSLSACIENLAQAPTLFADEYFWTLQLACLTSLLVVPIAGGLARLGRVFPKFGVASDLVLTFAFFVPGPIVGMTVVQLFASIIPNGEILATQTLIPTILAVSVRSGILAYAILRLAYLQIAASVWQSSRLDGGTWFRVMRIELPLIWPAVIIAALTTAVVSSGDVPATLPVLPPGVTTVGTRLFGLLHSGSRYQEAALAFWYFSAFILVGAAAWILIRFAARGSSSPRISS